MYHRAAAGPLHQRDRVAGGERRALEVDREHVVPHVEVDIHQRAVAAEKQDAGGIHQVIEPAARLAAVGHRLGHVGCRAQVGLHVAGAGWQVVRCGLHVEERRLRAGADQIACDLQPHAAAGAGHEGVTAAEVSLHLGHRSLPESGDALAAVLAGPQAVTRFGSVARIVEQDPAPGDGGA